MKQKVELGLAREFGDIISDSFVILRQNFKPLLKAYFVICGVFLIAGICADILFKTQHVFEGRASIFSLLGLVKILFSIINNTAMLVTSISYLTLYKEKGNETPSVMEVWSYFRYYFFRVFGTQLLMVAAFIIAFLFCIVPSIYLFPVLSLIIPIMISENASTEYSVRRAFKIISGNWWFTFGILLILTAIIILAMIILLVVPAIFIYGGTQWLAGISARSPYIIAEAIILHISQALWILPVIGTTLIYYTLTEQKESTTLLNRIKMFGKNTPDNDGSATEHY